MSRHGFSKVRRERGIMSQKVTFVPISEAGGERSVWSDGLGRPKGSVAVRSLRPPGLCGRRCRT
jgi:hypothetical protein